MFAFEQSGVEPDAVSLGKSMGAGMPIRASGGRREYETWPRDKHVTPWQATGSVRGRADSLDEIEHGG